MRNIIEIKQCEILSKSNNAKYYRNQTMRNIIEIKQCEILSKSNNAKYYRNQTMRNIIEIEAIKTKKLIFSKHLKLIQETYFCHHTKLLRV